MILSKTPLAGIESKGRGQRPIAVEVCPISHALDAENPRSDLIIAANLSTRDKAVGSMRAEVNRCRAVNDPFGRINQAWARPAETRVAADIATGPAFDRLPVVRPCTPEP